MVGINSFKRRTFLAVGASLISGLAECSAVFKRSSGRENSRPPPLYEIVIENHYTEKKRLDLVVERDGKIVHWDSYEIPTLGPRKDGVYTGKAIAINDKEWLGCGAYEVSARLPSEQKWATIDFRKLEPESGTDGKFRPVELNIVFSADQMSMTTTRIDQHFDCEKGAMVTSKAHGK